jgi:hypothetical protein
MAKDPAFLFYPNDWAGGTIAMTRHQKGCYLDLIIAQFNLGPLSLEEIKTVLGSDFGQVWPTLQKKFKCENGLYLNERLSFEKERRSNYAESRRKNRKSYVQHMENENRNENTNINYVIYGEFQNVRLTEAEYVQLVTKMGVNNTNLIIEELSGYIKSQGKDPYKDHYATIQNWARRKGQEYQLKVAVKGKQIV